jgi:hypothetical protein
MVALITLTIALKYVVYEDRAGKPVIERPEIERVVADINRTFAPCAIQFRVDSVVVTRPEEHGLSFSPSSMSELNPIRRSFDRRKELVLVHTGPWDKSRGLGADGANAWTMMPGERVAGTVMEAKVAKNPGLVAHELGHYLGLRHLKDQGNLMNPVIYAKSRKLEPDQCAELRETAAEERGYAIRTEVSPPPPGA